MLGRGAFIKQLRAEAARFLIEDLRGAFKGQDSMRFRSYVVPHYMRAASGRRPVRRRRWRSFGSRAHAWSPSFEARSAPSPAPTRTLGRVMENYSFSDRRLGSNASRIVSDRKLRLMERKASASPGNTGYHHAWRR